MSRSTWACELKFHFVGDVVNARRHAPRERVSWNTNSQKLNQTLNSSRSTWACELKLRDSVTANNVFVSHAPRERVSWNFAKNTYINNCIVTLHVSVWVEILFLLCYPKKYGVTLHVSVWVEIDTRSLILMMSSVTLHVSVWVEIWACLKILVSLQSRSTWACELKCVKWQVRQ